MINNKMVSAMLGEEVQIFVPIALSSTDHSNARKTTIAGHTKYAVTAEGTEAYVTLNAKIPTASHVFFYAPSDYPRETKMSVDNEKFGDFMANESNRIKSIGKFDTGETVTVKLTLSSENLYLKNDEAYFYCLNVAVLDAAMTKLSSNQFDIQRYSDTKLEGTINTSVENSTIQTSIPYDEGWRVYVDGKRVDICKTFDSLISFDISGEGAHTLKLVYIPTVIILGAGISVVSTAIFVLLCLLERQKKFLPQDPQLT